MGRGDAVRVRSSGANIERAMDDEAEYQAIAAIQMVHVTHLLSMKHNHIRCWNVYETQRHSFQVGKEQQ
jgi:hypothetical protein